tara:strand:+ start:72 stop:482 length:411 start_codon:yes stop_codon:yes gene_type:complete
MKYLGVDYGDKKIGLAIAGSDVRVALVYDSIKTENAINKIKRICNIENIDQIVIGLPLSMKGFETEQTQKTKKFINLLKAKIDLQINEHDERLTTRMSGRITSGKPSLLTRGEKLKIDKDQASAVLILQSYIDMIK